MSKTSQREATFFNQGHTDGKNATKALFHNKYYKKNSDSRFYKKVAPYGYAAGWNAGFMFNENEDATDHKKVSYTPHP